VKPALPYQSHLVSLRRSNPAILRFIAVLLSAAAFSGSVFAQQDAAIPDRIITTDQAVGTGLELKRGRYAVLQYTGWIYDAGAPDGKGKRFASSLERGEPLSYVYGYERAIRGLERGMQGMRVGGKRTIVIPPNLGYQEPKHPYPKDVPQGSALVFEVELLNVVPQGAPADQ
jgi:FKBP-type peptidyl-prolyl cis-trans isomerase FkpA